MSHFYFNEIKKGKLIIHALAKYGAMSSRSLRLVVPDIQHEKNFTKSLKKLVERGLIVKCLGEINRETTAYYKINQKPFVREALTSYLGISQDDLKQEDFRFAEFYHDQHLIRVAYWINQHFPHATVIREHKLAKNDEARNVISGLEDFDTPKPDLLVLIPSGENKLIKVAIEYEKTIKSKARVLRKINFYTHRTALDGVIYLYDYTRGDHNFHEKFITHALNRSSRIHHYPKNFLLTSSYRGDVENSMDHLCNRDKSTYSFKSWIEIFTRYSSKNLRDEYFSQILEPPIHLR